MLQLRIATPAALADDVLALLDDDPAVSSLGRVRGASITPPGDLFFADVAREAANDLIERLRALGVHEHGTLHIDPAETWMSRDGYAAERLAPGSGADSVVWAEVTQRAYADSELNWTFLSFMTLATLLASIAIVLDSQVLVIGAMVIGPEFTAIAALGLALVRRRPALLGFALRSLVVGFGTAIVLATLAALLGRAAGWVDAGAITAPRPLTGFVYSPDRWSFLIAVIAGAAGVLSLTSSKVGGLSGVFISVTTIPAAGNLALALAFGLPAEIRGSALQLAVNIAGMALAGWVTLALQQTLWRRVPAPRAHQIPPPGRTSS